MSTLDVKDATGVTRSMKGTGAASSGDPFVAARAADKQVTASFALQAGATASGNGTAATADGYNGALQLLIANGAGSCTVNVEGSFDNFATAQNVFPVGVVLLATETGGVGTTNTSRAVAGGSVTVAANTSYAYALQDVYPYVRARVSGASGLGAGSNLTGCSVTLYALPQ